MGQSEYFLGGGARTSLRKTKYSSKLQRRKRKKLKSANRLIMQWFILFVSSIFFFKTLILLCLYAPTKVTNRRLHFFLNDIPIWFNKQICFYLFPQIINRPKAWLIIGYCNFFTYSVFYLTIYVLLLLSLVFLSFNLISCYILLLMLLTTNSLSIHA